MLSEAALGGMLEAAQLGTHFDTSRIFCNRAALDTLDAVVMVFAGFRLGSFFLFFVCLSEIKCQFTTVWLR